MCHTKYLSSEKLTPVIQRPCRSIPEYLLWSLPVLVSLSLLSLWKMVEMSARGFFFFVSAKFIYRHESAPF